MSIHLKSAIPKKAAVAIHQISEELKQYEGGEQISRRRRIFLEMEKWLDRAQGVDYLARPAIAAVIMEAIEDRVKRKKWRVIEFVIMPNHIHLFFEPYVSLFDLIVDFKRWTGRQSLKLLGKKSSAFWQREWFDHWSRSADENERIKSYICNNPVKAGLVKNFLNWPNGSWKRD